MKSQQAAIILTIFLASTGISYAISPAVKSYKDYALIMDCIRNMYIMVENFGDDQLKKRYADIKGQFQDAGESYYGQDFTASELKFKKLKYELISILEAIDDIYLKRTKEIMDSTVKETFSVLIEYSKDSGLAAYFFRPFDPLKDVKPYEPEKYHFFHDKEKIEAYLRDGYRLYYKAKNIFEDPEIATLRKKTNLTTNNLNFIISSYLNVIDLCRGSKENGIEIYRIKNINELGKSMIKYNVSHGTLIPIYDDRIPEQYKVDANDNMKLINSIEMKRILKTQGNNKRG